MWVSYGRKVAATLCLSSLIMAACSNATPAPAQVEVTSEVTTQVASRQETSTPLQDTATSTPRPTTALESSLSIATVTAETELTPTPMPTEPADVVNVRLQVVSEVGQPVYLNREMVTLTRVDDGVTIEMIGRNDEFFNAVQPGDYILQINSPSYEPFVERIAVSDADLELTATLKLIGIAANPEDLVLLGGTVFNYETGEVLVSGPAFGAVQYVRPDKRSFLATNGLVYAIILPDGSVPYNQLTLEESTSQTPLKEMPFGYAVSPDLSTALFESANDIWVGEIDWDKGLIRNARQVTQVGAFNGSVYDNANVVWHPDGEYVLLWNRYRVNLKSGQVKTFENGIGQISPDGRYGFRFYPSRMYDWATDIEYPLEVDVQRGCWREDGTRVYVDKSQLRFAKQGQESTLDIGVELRGDLGCQGNYLVGRRKENPENTLTFVNLETGDTFDGPKSLEHIKITGDYAVGSVFDDRDFEIRGTYLFNLKEGSFNRVSALPANSSSDSLGRLGEFYNIVSVILPDKDTVMFVANQQLWKTDLAGAPATKLADITDPDMLNSGRMLRLQLLPTQ